MNDLFKEEDKALNDAISNANVSKTEEYTEIKDLKQGSKAWFNLRLEKFTGSKFPDLMKKGRGKEEWGLTALKVIQKVYIERDLTDIGRELYIDEMYNKEFRQTKWGNFYEDEARAKYVDIYGFSVDVECFKIHKTIPFVGGSFDGTIVDLVNGQKGIIEIKCPYDIVKHLENFDLIENGIDEKHPYYGQIQGNIEVAGVDFCDFISYDPRRKNDNIAIIGVQRDQDYIDRLLKRILVAEMAVSIMELGVDVYGAVLLAEKKLSE